MAKHRHAEMIKAKADNIGLVVFVNDDIGGELKWREMVNSFPISPNHEYFLCLPQRKDACLHWLNGGDVEFRRDGEEWQDECEKYHGWADYCGMMNNDVEFRIKPHKEKRWIVAHPCALASMMYFESEELARKAVQFSPGEFKGGQVIEIEVEV